MPPHQATTALTMTQLCSTDDLAEQGFFHHFNTALQQHGLITCSRASSIMAEQNSFSE